MTPQLKHENGTITMPDLDYTSDPRGIGYVFFENMASNKEKIAQIDAFNHIEDSYANLLSRCIRCAIEMRKSGVTSDDIISICSSNQLNSCVPFIATFFVGATIASFDPALSLHDTTHLLKSIKPKLMFVSEDAIELIENAVKASNVKVDLVAFGTNSEYKPFSKFLKETSEEQSFVPYSVEDLTKTGLILFSSGTTGLPKGICISHCAYLGQVQTHINFAKHYERSLLFSSLYWVSACLDCGSAIVRGLTRIILPKFNAEQLWKAVETYKVNYMFLSPFLAISLYKSGHPGIDFSSLQEICIGGGPASENVIANLRQALPKVRIFLTYGLSEIGYVSYFWHQIYDKYAIHKPGSSGVPVLGMSVKIIDPNTGNSLDRNEKGEILLKSAFTLTGYHNLDSSDVWDSDGWLKTGDIGYYDDNYCLYIVDRIKEMLKFRSFHVIPSITESALLSHPCVKAAFVFGIPHDIDGDHPTAAVVLKEYSKKVDSADLIKFVDERVDDRQRLRGGIQIVNDIPMTPTGKINRRLAKTKILEEYFK